MSRFAKRCIESFRQCNPGWEVKLWDEEAVAALPRMGKLCGQALEQADLRFEVFSDLAKPEVILETGGFYSDCDIEFLDSLEPLVHHEVVLGCKAKGKFHEEQPTLCFFGFPAGHSYLKRVLDHLEANIDPILNRPYEINRLIGGWRSAQIENPLPFAFNCSVFKTRFKSVFRGKVSCLIEKKRGEMFGIHFAKSTPKKPRAE